jgi:hypothetical protein
LLADVGIGSGPLAGVGVELVLLGDLAVLVGVVRREPFLGGDDGLGLGVGTSKGKLGLGPVTGCPGDCGVREPAGAGVVDLLQLARAVVESRGERSGLPALLPQAIAVRLDVRPVCFRSAQGGSPAMRVGGLAGAGKLVRDVARRPLRPAMERKLTRLVPQTVPCVGSD